MTGLPPKPWRGYQPKEPTLGRRKGNLDPGAAPLLHIRVEEGFAEVLVRAVDVVSKMAADQQTSPASKFDTTLLCTFDRAV